MTHMIEELFVEVGRHQLEEVRVQQREHLVPRGLVHEGVVHAVHRQRGGVAVAARPEAPAAARVTHGDVRVPRVPARVFSADKLGTRYMKKLQFNVL